MIQRGLVAASLVVALATAGCGKKKQGPSAEVTGLAAVPASAEVVITADVARVASSPLVDRAIDQLLLRDAGLATRWQKLQDSCKLDTTKIKHVTLAIGPKAGTGPGTGPVLMVATGQLVETDLSACVRAMVGQGGGSLTARQVDGRTLYQAKDGNRTMFFAFGRADTVLLSANEAFLTEALATGPRAKKALDNPDLAKWIGLADQKAPLWAAGRVDPRVRDGLVRVTQGQLSAGPAAMVVAVDPSSGAKIQVGAVMASAADAKTLESFAKTQLAAIGMVAQAKSLGTIVDKIQIAADGNLVRFTANLSPEQVNQVLSALDAGGTSEQDSPPAGSGTGSAGSAGSAAP